jgi:hypothetical protein
MVLGNKSLVIHFHEGNNASTVLMYGAFMNNIVIMAIKKNN